MTLIPIAIFFISAAALGLELVLVRALSIGHWHHFSYLVISTALLGFGAGGTLVCIGSRPLTKHCVKSLWGFAFGFGLAVPLAFYVSQKVPFDELQLIWDIRRLLDAPTRLWDARQVLCLFAYYLLFFVPFFCAGGFVALAFTVCADKAHRLYFYNMTGSGLGVVAAVGLMYGHSPEQLLLVSSAAGFLAAMILAFGMSRRWLVVTPVCALVFLVFSAGGGIRLEIEISEHKSLVYHSALPEAEKLATVYSPLGRVDCIKAPSIHIPPAGLSIAYQGGLPEQILIISDADGISVVNRLEAGSDRSCYEQASSALAYQLVKQPAVCIIGAGGGSDVIQALALGAGKVTAVEMNPQVVELVRDRFDEFTSGLYKHKDVEVVVAEGRSFLQTTRRRFDIISISLLDSYAASAAGVGAFNESHLYTVEAIEQALARLKANGVLSITRMLKAPPRDNVKMFATVTEALRRRRIVEPAKHIMMIRSLDVATIVASPKAFSDLQISKVREFAQEHSFDLVHVPGVKAEEVNQFHMLDEGPIYYSSARQILSPEYEQFYRNYAYNIRPATDDRPYFFDFFKWKSLSHMKRTMGAQWLPFSEWGYLLLLATLVQAAVASAVLILVPLLAAKRMRTVRSRKVPSLVYFLLLGFAYMFLEMGFIQKMTLLIGHPVFGVGVTLLGFLAFSGCGSLASGRLFGPARRKIAAAVSAIVIIGLVEIWVTRYGFNWLVGFSRPMRILLGLAMTAPLAFFMGMPFPTGLKQIHINSQPLVPWAWGVNGFASVTGAVLGTFLAISIGFMALTLIALVCYLFAAIISKRICA
jgi:spermidine synthase